MTAGTERMVTAEDGAQLAYEVRADAPEDALPILALHGVLVGTSNWIHQFLRLPQFRWIAPSIRGHGNSAPVDGTPSVEQAARDALQVLDAEGVDQAVVVGNSLGATVGLAIGLLYPERVRALVLVEPSVPAILLQNDDRLTSAAEKARGLLNEGRTEDALDLFLRPRIGEDWPTKVGRRRLAEWRRNVISTPAWFDAVAEFYPSPAQLALLHLPTLLVHGADTQPVYRELTDAVAEAVPAADLVSVPNAGHGVPADNPDAFNALLLDYLTGLGLVDPSAS